MRREEVRGKHHAWEKRVRRTITQRTDAPLTRNQIDHANHRTNTNIPTATESRGEMRLNTRFHRFLNPPPAPLQNHLTFTLSLKTELLTRLCTYANACCGSVQIAVHVNSNNANTNPLCIAAWTLTLAARPWASLSHDDTPTEYNGEYKKRRPNTRRQPASPQKEEYWNSKRRANCLCHSYVTPNVFVIMITSGSLPGYLNHWRALPSARKLAHTARPEKGQSFPRHLLGTCLYLFKPFTPRTNADWLFWKNGLRLPPQELQRRPRYCTHRTDKAILTAFAMRAKSDSVHSAASSTDRNTLINSVVNDGCVTICSMRPVEILLACTSVFDCATKDPGCFGAHQRELCGCIWRD